MHGQRNMFTRKGRDAERGVALFCTINDYCGIEQYSTVQFTCRVVKKLDSHDGWRHDC